MREPTQASVWVSAPPAQSPPHSMETGAQPTAAGFLSRLTAASAGSSKWENQAATWRCYKRRGLGRGLERSWKGAGEEPGKEPPDAAAGARGRNQHIAAAAGRHGSARGWLGAGLVRRGMMCGLSAHSVDQSLKTP